MNDRDTEAREAALDAAFVRQLITSARGDEHPQGSAQAAWLRFSGAIAAASALAAGVELARATAASGKLGALAAAKWLVIGAIGGGSVTAAWMLAQQPATAPQPALRVAAPSVMAPAPKAPERPFSARSGPGETPAVGPREPAAPEPAVPQPRVSRERTRPGPSLEPPRGSTLAAQVSLLDAARTANAVGAAGDALRLIEKYHREFPRGELSADADVVALEARVAQNDARAVARHARRFLARYPNDPHAAYVAKLAADAEKSREP